VDWGSSGGPSDAESDSQTGASGSKGAERPEREEDSGQTGGNRTGSAEEAAKGDPGDVNIGTPGCGEVGPEGGTKGTICKHAVSAGGLVGAALRPGDVPLVTKTRAGLQRSSG